MKPITVALLSLGSLSLWTGCSEDDPPTADPCLAFNTTLAVQDRMMQPVAVFNSGETIRFAMTIANTLDQPATLTAATTCSPVEHEVLNAAKQRVWLSSDGIFCFAMLQPRTYAPKESVLDWREWNQQAAPGQYTVISTVGQFMTDSQGRQHDCKVALSKTASFTIQ